jgi:hypothetical protein
MLDPPLSPRLRQFLGGSFRSERFPNLYTIIEWIFFAIYLLASFMPFAENYQ